MNDIMEKTYLLIDELDKSSLIKNLTLYKEKILNNEEIQKLLIIGNNSSDDYVIIDIKKKLYEYDEYKNYMKYYNRLMYIVMDINHRFHGLTNVSDCGKKGAL